MILIACTRRIDAHPSLVVVWGIVQSEADRFTGHGLQHLNCFV